MKEGGYLIFIDFEVFKHDWLVCYLDTKTRKMYSIVNDKSELESLYKSNRGSIFVGYNIRGYDQWILKAILCDFNPYAMSDWIINKDKKGHLFSNLLNKFPLTIYDCSIFGRSLKELEAFQGHNIHETSVPFDIDRPLTTQEIEETIKYCMNDVMEAFNVFVEKKDVFESHVGMVTEFNLPMEMISKTQTQLSAEILGAVKVTRNDEFDITIPDNVILGKYDWIREHFLDWAKNSKNYKEFELETEIAGVTHKFGVGGLHGALKKYHGEGYYIMADVASYYPAGMIEYDLLSRNVRDRTRYRKIRDDRIALKKAKNPKQESYKLILNKTFGGSKDPYNKLYDPLQANNLCIANQLFLVDLIEKLEGKCELIQSNTDGILLKLFKVEDKDSIIEVCESWCERTRFVLEYGAYSKVFQKDVNNYLILPFGELCDEKGKERFKRKGSVKQLNPLDNNLPILNRALVDYFCTGKPLEQTIMESDKLIDFQIVTKVSSKYKHATHNGIVMTDKIYRVFASLDNNDGTLYKTHKNKDTLDKTASTPENCFIDNGDITDKLIPSKLDKQWYLELARTKVTEFIGS